MTHTPAHRSIRFVHRAPAPPEIVFPLLCPVREHDWVEGWQADVLHSESGVAELGCVFLADARGTHGPVTFVVSRYEPPHAIEFVVFRAGVVEHLQISLRGSCAAGGSSAGGAPTQGSEETSLEWRRAYTGLTPEGNACIEKNVPEAALARMRELDRMLVGYLERSRERTLATI